MSKQLVIVTIVFKVNGERAMYQASPEVAGQIAGDFERSCLHHEQGHPRPPNAGTYDVQDDKGSPCKLALRFADVLYVG